MTLRQTGGRAMAKRNGWITIKSIMVTVGMIILAGFIIGGLYVARERGEEVRRETAIQQAQERLEEIAAQEVKEESETKEPPVNQGVEELPATGIQDVMTIFAVGALTFAIASYVQSQRRLAAISVS